MRSDQWDNNVTNGIESEYNIGCAIYDLWDGPNHLSHIPGLIPDHWNDIPNSGLGPNWDIGLSDDVELDFAVLCNVIATTSNAYNVEIEGVLNFYHGLTYEQSCEFKKEIKEVFDQNRCAHTVAEPIFPVLEIPPIGGVSSDVIAVYIDEFMEANPGTWWTLQQPINYTYNQEVDVNLLDGAGMDYNLGTQNINQWGDLSDNLTIQNGATLFLNRYTTLGWVTENNPALPVTNSTFHVSVCGGTNFTIGNNGTINIGDVTTTCWADLVIEDGSAIDVEQLGHLIINNNSKITVKSGGTLLIRQNANLEMIGNSTIIVEDGGYICIENGANLVLANFDNIQLSSGAISNINSTTGLIHTGICMEQLCGEFTSMEEPPQFEIYGSSSWNNKNYVILQDVVVHDNATLTISNTSNIRFADNIKIVVNVGGRLIIDNSTLTNVDACHALWRGIKVCGDGWASQSPTSNQGYVQFNNSIIENASRAISNYDGIKSKRGGIVKVYNSAFKNNIIAIELNGYSNFMNSNSSVIVDNISLIRNCEFITTDYLSDLGINPDAFIYLIGVEGVEIIGNRFTNQNPTSYNLYYRGYGINSIGASFDVDQICSYNVSLGDLCPDNYRIPNEFKSLTFGISAYGCSENKNISVKNSKFVDCFKGVKLEAGVDFAVIKGNSFNLPFSNNYIDISYGLMVVESTGYEIENNLFESPGGIINQGVVISDSHDDVNIVYNNEFKNMKIGIFADQDNDGPNYYDGLDFKCNKFTGINSNVNIKVAGPVSTFQGSCSELAGNQFSHACLSNGSQYSDFDIVDGVQLFYYAKNNVSYNTFPTCYENFKLVVWTCNGTYDPALSCPTDPFFAVGNGFISENLVTMKIEADNLIKKKDAGNTDGFIAAVNGNSAPGQVKNLLMTGVPYVTADVLIDVITHNPAYPPGIIKDILLANSPLEEEVWKVIQQNPGLLPGGILNTINQAQNGTSPMEILDRDIAQILQKRGEYKNELIRRYFQDSLAGLDSVIVILKNENDDISNRLLLSYYLDLGDCSSASEIYSQIEFNSQEDGDFIELYKMLIDLCTAGLEIYDITPEQETLIREIANGESNVSSVAEAIIVAVYAEYFPDNIQFMDESDEFTIVGNVYENIDCGGEPIEGASVGLFDSNNIPVEGVTPVVTDIEGKFTFNRSELGQLDNTALFALGTIGGISIQNPSYLTIDELILDTAIVLTLTDYHRYWANTYSETDSIYNTGTAIDLGGNIYVAGTVGKLSSGYDCLLLKYSPDGDQLWAVTYNGIGSGSDWAYDLALDEEDNCYITGTSQNSGNDYGIITLKYNSNGDLLWSRRFDGVLTGADAGYGIVFDNGGYVYITGRAVGVTGKQVMTTLKYDSNGNLIWNKLYEGMGYSSSTEISLDVNGDVIVAGWGVNSQDFLVNKYNPNGLLLWSLHKDIGSSDIPYALGIDSKRNIYVAGSSIVTVNADLTIMKISPLGDMLWGKVMTGLTGGNDYAYDLVIDDADFVYVGGSIDNKYATMKLMGDGELVWNSEFGGGLGYIDVINAIGLDSDNNVYVTGNSGPISAKSREIVTIKYNSFGEQEWLDKYYYYDKLKLNIGNDLVVSQNNNVYITGNAYNGSNYDVLTIKYAQCFSTAHLKSTAFNFGTNQESEQDGGKTKTSQNEYFNLYPNPNDGNMMIDYAFISDVDGELVIYNLQGVVVATYPLNYKNHKVFINNDILSDGMYFFNINQNSKSIYNGKLVIVKYCSGCLLD